MKIDLKIPDGDFAEYEVEDGSTIEDVYKAVKDSAPYTCVCAKVNNQYQSLTYRLEMQGIESCRSTDIKVNCEHGAESSCGTDIKINCEHGAESSCGTSRESGSGAEQDELCSDTSGSHALRVELLDVRNPGASRVYQAGISMVFLAAAKKVLGDTVCVLANTLARGIFIELKDTVGTTDETADKIREEMRAITDRDAVISRQYLTREEILDKLKNTSYGEKFSIIDSNLQVPGLEIYDLDGYRVFFYPIMVPSAGYVSIFSLERYKKGLLLRFPNQYVPDGIPEFIDEPNMYKAFAEQNEWDKLLGINYVPDLNRKIEQGGSMDLIQLSEALHDKKITEIASMITGQGKRLVLIAGPSSSGKTTFAKRLCIHLRVNGCKALYMGTDDYFVDRDQLVPDENGEIDYENLDAVDTALFNDNMRDLLKGLEVDLPEFDFIEGKKIFGKRKTKIDSKTVLVIEGIHALNEVLTSEISREEKFKIYISPLTGLNIDSHNRVPTTDERLLRRIVRDERTRGRGAAQTIADWPKVRRGEDRNIFRYNDEADVMFNSYHVYEIAVLKKYAEPLLRAITEDMPEYAEARRLLDTLGFFSVIEDDAPVGNDSILREFIGGSIYVL
ncbi:MAG: nucleoside kinase [Eubacterium sp.]|nr:nucleoside kinase [Eubacterium sp.]